MNFDEKETLIQSLKREILRIPTEGTVTVNFGKDAIHRIIPHREPIALVSSIAQVNLGQSIIEATSYVNPSDPVFAGHFPGKPIYPGVLQIEMMGQAGLCLAYFTKNNTTTITDDSQPVRGLFTRVHHAGFNKGVLPGDLLTIRVKSLEDDDFMGLMSAQIVCNNEICSHSILEVYYP